MQSEWIVGFATPFPTPLAKIPSASAHARDVQRSTQSGAPERSRQRDEAQAREALREIAERRKFPHTAPAPNAAKRMPAIFGSESKRCTTSTGTAAKNASHAASPARKSGIHTRSNGSRNRTRRPVRIPRDSGAAGTEPPPRHEQGDERERDDVRRGVDDQHARRAHHADQHAADRRPEQHRRADRALEERVRLADDLLVLAEELGHDHPLRREVRRAERTEQERERDERRERQVAGPVQHRHEQHQRRANGVREQHRPARPSRVGSVPEGSPVTATPISSAAMTPAIRAGEPSS